MGRAEKVRFGLALALGVFVPGLLNYALNTLGYPALGTAVWVTGYLTAVLAIWYVWLRPLDFEGAAS
jgi:Na+-transporting NADH:ubiquinone oxidoreductase subunit NqrB